MVPFFFPQSSKLLVLIIMEHDQWYSSSPTSLVVTFLWSVMTYRINNKNPLSSTLSCRRVTFLSYTHAHNASNWLSSLEIRPSTLAVYGSARLTYPTNVLDPLCRLVVKRMHALLEALKCLTIRISQKGGVGFRTLTSKGAKTHRKVVTFNHKLTPNAVTCVKRLPSAG